MRLLLDTHLLLWAAGEPDKLSARARTLMEDPGNDLVFSAASLWEITIKTGLGRADFQVDPHLLRRGLIENGYEELPITSQHALAVRHLPDVHRDPFDRILVAQA
ncbi:type II toxin-antitoxin system VapC family toxin, partial [Acetobacter orientalis]|uniref:type II toxin-antitoxin system VapC family toxin n=1 Tax=Acetobacter orientalis TaxID=146474 RepID=UPI0039EC784D